MSRVKKAGKNVITYESLVTNKRPPYYLKLRIAKQRDIIRSAKDFQGPHLSKRAISLNARRRVAEANLEVLTRRLTEIEQEKEDRKARLQRARAAYAHYASAPLLPAYEFPNLPPFLQPARPPPTPAVAALREEVFFQSMFKPSVQEQEAQDHAAAVFAQYGCLPPPPGLTESQWAHEDHLGTWQAILISSGMNSDAKKVLDQFVADQQRQEEKSGLSDSKSCSICMEDYGAGKDPAIMPCNRHHACRACAEEWAARKAGVLTCPECRASD